MLSQNRFDVLLTNRTTGALPRLRKWVIPGANRHVYLRDGSVGFLLVHFALWWHESLHRLDLGTWDEWGWAVRPVRGQTSGYSNHASGSAVDLDATQHPRGVPILRTFKPFQIAKIRARIRFYRGALRWGGDYKSTVDGMHVELNTDLAGAERMALRLLNSPRGKRILAANPGARAVIVAGTPLEGKVPPKSPPPATPVTFRSGTFNSQHTDATAQSTAQLRATIPLADVWGLQEIETEAQRAALRSLTDYGLFMPDGSGGAVPILWRLSVFEQVSAKSRLVHSGVAHATPARYINTVILRHKATGRLVVRKNTQVVHHVEVAGLPRKRDLIPGQVDRAKIHFAALRADVIADSKLGPVVWGGDLNVDYLAEKRLPAAKRCAWFPLTSLSAVSSLDLPPGGTHGSRGIDWTGHTGPLKVAGQAVLPAGASDHRAVVTTYTFVQPKERA